MKKTIFLWAGNHPRFSPARTICNFAMIAGIMIVFLWLFAGCATIKRAREAQDRSKTPAGERTVRPAEVGLEAGTSLTLERAVEIGLKYHPSVVQARESVVVAESQAKDAVSAYFPTVTASAGYTRSYSEGGSSSGGNTSALSPELLDAMGKGGGEKDQYSAQISLDQLLFDFGRTSASVRQANLNVISARERLRLAQSTVVYQVRLAYYDLTKSQALVTSAEEEVKQFESHLEQMKILSEVGRQTGYEVTKSEVNLGNAQTNLLNAQNAVKTARASLNRAMGLAEDAGYSVVEPPVEDLDRSFEELMDEARKHNPEYLALTAEDKMASALVDQSIAGLFPKITLSGKLSWNGSEFPLSYGWSLGPAIVQTIFDGFRTINNIDQTAAQLRSAHARQAAKEQEIYLDLSKAVAQLENARQRVRVAEEVEKQAQLNRSQVEDRYQVGRASLLELTDAQLTLTQAQTDLVQARNDLQSAIALIRLTTGEDLE